MSNITMNAEKPDEIRFTLNVTFTLEQWNQLRQQLVNAEYSYPANELKTAISEITAQANKTYRYEGE